MKSTSDGLFQHSGLRSWLVKLRLPLFIVVLMLLAPFVRHDWLLAGFTVSMVGELIQLWCFASLDKNATLTARGPYSMVRNPMYLGRFFILLGFLMLLGNGWLLLAYAVVYWLYMDARVRREEAHLRPIFGAAYEDYCRTVRRCAGWPPPAAAAYGAGSSSGEQRRNLLATLAAWALMAAWTIWGVPALHG
jgi:protein-S-isoprenylcysteine O-methyltransferase Ste14